MGVMLQAFLRRRGRHAPPAQTSAPFFRSSLLFLRISRVWKKPL